MAQTSMIAPDGVIDFADLTSLHNGNEPRLLLICRSLDVSCVVVADIGIRPFFRSQHPLPVDEAETTPGPND
jgi:hypothetical protein